MLRALNRAAVPGFASTSGFPMRTFPASSFASIAIVGAIIRHGPHHAAHISSRTGKCDPSTTDAKFASVTLTGSEDGAGRAALHFPQTGCFSRAAPNRTRFFAPQFGHGTTKLFAGAAMILSYCAGPIGSRFSQIQNLLIQQAPNFFQVPLLDANTPNGQPKRKSPVELCVRKIGVARCVDIVHYSFV